MSDAKQAEQLAEEVHKVIRRFSVEYDMSLAATIGVLEMVKLEVLRDYGVNDAGEEYPKPFNT